MGLEDFEREIAQSKAVTPTRGHKSKDSSRDEERRKHRHHHHRSRHERDGGERSHHRSKRDDHDHGRDDEDGHRSKRRRSESPKEPKSNKPREDEDDDEEEDEWVEKEAMTAPPEEAGIDQRAADQADETLTRDSWMQAPSALDIDYVQRSRHKKSPPSQFVSSKEDHDRKVHQQDIQDLVRDLEEDEDAELTQQPGVKDEPAQHDVSYTFGDSGSQWRMSKLRAVYRKAKDAQRSVEEIAQEQYGDLRDFDDAREEERELERRDTYGRDYVGLEKPSGELFQERKMAAGIHRRESGDTIDRPRDDAMDVPQGATMEEAPTTAPLDQTSLNKLKAQLMKAKLRKDPNAAQLEREYNLAMTASSASTTAQGSTGSVVVLNNVENRMLASGRSGEVTRIDNKRGRERGLVVENEDMSIADMVRSEKRTRTNNSGQSMAERIAKDAKFDTDLDYQDDNATKLAQNVARSDINLRNTAISDYHKTRRALDTCPLCHHEDTSTPPQAPVVSLATRVYLTLPTEPEISSAVGAVIVPIEHHANLLCCDDDEWEEVRNFQKSLIKFYASRDLGVIFYENAAHSSSSSSSRKTHAALVAVPLPLHVAANAPAFFKEAILAADEEWTQHKKIVDTLALAASGTAKTAFRRALVKEMPYFHVWFTIDGGMGHVVEDERRWPRGDLFAREVLGGMLDKGPDVVKKQGRWTRLDRRVEGFRKRWENFDWTAALMDAQ